MNVYGAAAGWLARVPVIATVHGRGYYAEARRRLLALRLAARSGAVVVAVSSDIQHFLESEVGIPRVRLVPNGIDAARFLKLEPETLDLLAKLDLEQAAPILLLPVSETSFRAGTASVAGGRSGSVASRCSSATSATCTR